MDTRLKDWEGPGRPSLVMNDSLITQGLAARHRAVPLRCKLIPGGYLFPQTAVHVPLKNLDMRSVVPTAEYQEHEDGNGWYADLHLLQLLDLVYKHQPVMLLKPANGTHDMRVVIGWNDE